MSNLLKILACLLALQTLISCTVTTNSGTKTYSVTDILNTVDQTLSGKKAPAEDSGSPNSGQPLLKNKTGELLPQAKRLSWERLLFAQMQLHPNFDFAEHAYSYMRIFRPKVWNQYRNDEFELASKRAETIAIMQQRTASFDSKDLFLIQTSFNFGNYDFNQKMFPLDSISESSLFSYSKSWTHSFPREYELGFTNPAIIGDLYMDEAEAKQFLQKRKHHNGHIDRKVYAKLFFSNLQTDGINNTFTADLKNVYVYSDSEYRLLLAQYSSNHD